jgi:hypothetical protein
LTAALLVMSRAASGTQAGDQALVRVAHFRRGRDQPSSSPGGRRFALLLLIGGGLTAAAGFVVQRRSTG